MMLTGGLISMLVTMVAMPLLAAGAHGRRLAALPDARRVHVRPTPQVGGLAMFAGVFAGSLLFLTTYPQLALFLMLAAPVVVVGAADDWRGVDFRLRLGVQAVAAGAVLLLVGAGALSVAGFGLRLDWPLFGFAVSVLLIVGVTNALNLSDGLDGLAGGLALMSGLGLVVLGLQVERTLTVALTSLLAGGVFGFLRFNSHPARVFMGDAGAYFLGFCLAFGGVYVCCGERPVSVFALLMVFGIPVYDTVSVALRRLARGSSPFAADRNHLHHRLQASGLSHDQTVLVIYVLHALLAGSGLLLAAEPDPLVLLVCVVWFAAIETGVGWAERRPLGLLLPVRRAGHGRGGWRAWGDLAALTLMAAVASLGSLLAPVPGADFAAVAALLGGVMLVRMVWPACSATVSWPERAALYVMSVYGVYFMAAADLGVAARGVETVLFGALGLWIVLKMVRGRDGLRLTAMDVLVVLATAAVTVFGGWEVDLRAVNLAQLLICFYAVEGMLAAAVPVLPLRLACVLTFAVIVVRHLW